SRHLEASLIDFILDCPLSIVYDLYFGTTILLVEEHIAYKKGFFAHDSLWSFYIFKVHYLAKGNLSAIWGSNENFLQGFRILSKLSWIPHPYRIAFSSFNRSGDLHAPNGRLYSLLYIFNCQAVSGYCTPVNIQMKVRFAHYSVCKYSFGFNRRHFF